MAIERTLVILKPDATRRGIEFEILNKFKRKGLEIVNLYRACPSEELLRRHYAEVIATKGNKIGDSIIRFMLSGPVIIALVEGNDAVECVRKYSGLQTQPKDCPPGTIRHDYSADSYDLADIENRSVENLIHTSDSKASAEREISLWFGHDGLVDKEPSNEYDEISDMIGYVTPDFIRYLVEASNKEKLMFHGIKNPDMASELLAHGVKPLTPESGPCSFWSTGLSLFLPVQDSPFFNYSGSHFKPDSTELSLAVTSYDWLQNEKHDMDEYDTDSQIRVRSSILIDDLSLIQVEVIHPATQSPMVLRKYRQAAEAMLLNGIAGQAYCGGFVPGKNIKFSKTIE